jgi:hypothetical protein
MTGIVGLTTLNVAEITPPLYPVVAAWMAEIVVLPKLSSVTVLPEIDATAGFELT